MHNYNEALEIAKQMYKGVHNQHTSEPRLNHNIRLAAQMPSDELKCVALFHDLYEMTRYTEKDLKALHFDAKVLRYIKALHRGKKKYLDYLLHNARFNDTTVVLKADIRDRLRYAETDSEYTMAELSNFILDAVLIGVKGRYFNQGLKRSITNEKLRRLRAFSSE
jgi:hypothetical protein